MVVDWMPVRMVRFFFNLWPPFFFTGIRVTAIAPDYRWFDVTMKLSFFNRNYVGVIFGGALFSMVDPFYMLILSVNLGREYIVWDKGAKIDFKKPGKGRLRARCEFSAEEIAAVRKEADSAEKYVFDRPVDILNEQGEVVATVIKTLYVKRKQPANN